jgi:DNA-binding response OmpR family regulator
VQQEVRVLIVEDEQDIRESLGELLEAEGFVVSQAENGRHALDSLAEAPALPAVILLDLMMPIMDGEQFRREQLADARLAQIPIVIMSAARDIAEVGERMQAFAVLKKPMSIDLLVEKLREAVTT